MTEFAFAFLDCEFGGLDPELHDITEIGVILTDYRLAELSSGEWKVKARPERITAEAAQISGYDAAAWADAKGVREVLTEFSAMLPKDRKVVPAGQNVRMDVMFLERAYKSCELPYPFDYHVIDLATLFYAWSLVKGEVVPALSLRQAATTAGLVQGARGPPRPRRRPPHSRDVPPLRGEAGASSAGVMAPASRRRGQ